MMSDWWTYELADLILFSSHTYFRLIELYNTAIWPLHILAVIVGCCLVALIWRQPAWHGKALSLILALCWLWIAWAFHWQRFTNIHWVANYFGIAFALQALLLFWFGVVKDQLNISQLASKSSVAGLCILGYALLVHPVTTLLTAHTWKQTELFAIVPDPTVMATVGILLLTDIKRQWWLMPVPVIWCFISAATLWVLESFTGAELFITGILAIGFFCSKQKS